MNGIFSPLTDALGPLGPVILAGGLGLLLVLLTIPALLKRREDPLDKLRRNQKEAAKGQPSQAQLRPKNSKDKLEKYSNFLEPQNEAEFSAVRLKLLRAGYRTKNAVRIYYFAQFTLGMGLLILGTLYVLIVNMTSDEPLGMPMTVVMSLGPAMLGYMGPKYWVTSRGGNRQKQIENGFPDSLDLLLVCVEAGQSLDQAILRVARETATSYPPLSEEFQLVSYEIKAGKDRSMVLRDMGERVGVPDVSSFVTVLVQSAAFGTPISEALRVYSAEMRDKRLMRAEETANKLPTKMTLVTMGLTVPPLMLILVGPSVYDVVQTLGGDKPLF